MKQAGEFKSFSVFADGSDTMTLVSRRLPGNRDGEDRMSETFADAQKMSELQSLLLMARLMLGDQGATAA